MLSYRQNYSNSKRLPCLMRSLLYLLHALFAMLSITHVHLIAYNHIHHGTFLATPTAAPKILNGNTIKAPNPLAAPPANGRNVSHPEKKQTTTTKIVKVNNLLFRFNLTPLNHTC